MGAAIESDAQAEDLLEASDAFDRGEFGTALDLYDALAEGGNAEAQYRLGVMYEQGLGTDPDNKIALAGTRWPRSSSLGRSGSSEHPASEGNGCYPEFQRIGSQNQQAAALGYAPAQYNLGVAYANGVGNSAIR